MPAPRVIIALLMVFAWGTGFFHQSLEAAGYLFEHEHHHPAYHDPANDHAHEHNAGDGDDHTPLWAQHNPQGAVLFAAFAVLLLAAILFHRALQHLLRAYAPAATLCLQRWRHTRDPIWHFVRRCAPDIAAPPVSLS
ncbi:hypothetical protein [Cephaloticoccus primus]|uniref:hypothetical protein n=1 Tax=Cephaloticoccus primus TaxID=1548207 RepID=UPI0012E8819B|nr:hypothetical protein [Cephaloticoccus primus]